MQNKKPTRASNYKQQDSKINDLEMSDVKSFIVFDDQDTNKKIVETDDIRLTLENSPKKKKEHKEQKKKKV